MYYISGKPNYLFYSDVLFYKHGEEAMQDT